MAGLTEHLQDVDWYTRHPTKVWFIFHRATIRFDSLHCLVQVLPLQQGISISSTFDAGNIEVSAETSFMSERVMSETVRRRRCLSVRALIESCR